jgi:glycine dehydrogenase subunit 2
VIARIVEEAYADASQVKSAPHAQAIHQIKAAPLEDPSRWAMTWRAYRRKNGSGAGGG